ncbi:MAG: hypothetical protein GY772_16960, partial [bacterium]|nr:hypothetical protein [bacterium]
MTGRGEGFASREEYRMRDLLTAILGKDPGNFSVEDAREVVLLAGSHASGTVCATGTYTAEEHRALQISEWTDDAGVEMVTVTSTFIQRVSCNLAKEEFEKVGAEGLAAKMAIRVECLQAESSEAEVRSSITDMMVRESRARARGMLEPPGPQMTLNRSHLVNLPPAKTEVDETERAERHREREEDRTKFAEMERLETKAKAFGREHERDRTRDRTSVSDAGSGFASAVAEPEDVIMVSSEGRSKTPDFSRSPTSEVSSAVVSQRQKCRRERADESPERDAGRAGSPPQEFCAATRGPAEDAEAMAASVPAPTPVPEAAVGVVSAPVDGSASAGASGCDGSAAHPGTAPKARPKRVVTEVRPEEPQAPTVEPPPAPPPPASCTPDVMDVDLEAQEVVEPQAPVSARDLAWEVAGREPARKVVLTAAKPQASAASTTAPPTTAARSSGADTPARTATASRWSSGGVVQTAEQEVKTRWHELVPEPRPWVG